MRLKSMLLLAVASGCGLVAMFIFQMTRGQTAGAEEKIKVLVATGEITPGSRLDETNTEFREYPISVVPDNAVLTPEEFKDRAVKVRAFAGDLITIDKLGEAGAANDIPKGMVTVAIPVDASMTGGGLLLPGDRVDVFVTYTTANRSGLGKDIKTVVEHVEVWATDNKREITETTTGESKVKTITLLVTPQQAMLVKLAEDVGKLHLATRSRDDAQVRASEKDRFDPRATEPVAVARTDDEMREKGMKEEPEPQADLNQLLAQNSSPKLPELPAIKQPATPTEWTIEIYAGDQKRVETVPLRPEDVVEIQGGNPLLNGFKALFGRGARADRGPEVPPAGTDQEVPVPAGPVVIPGA